MKIGLVCNNYAPYVGGVEIHAMQLARELSMQHDVSITAMNFRPHRLPGRLAMLHNSLLAPHRADNLDAVVKIHSLSPSAASRLWMLPMLLRATPKLQRYFYHQINRLTHPFYVQGIAKKLRRALSGCDVIHSLAFGDLGWAAERTSRAVGAAHVCTPFVHPEQWGDGPQDIQYYRRCDAVIGLVKSDCDYLGKLGVTAEKLHEVGVSPNLVASPDGRRFREKHDLGNKLMVLYVGRLMRQKGAGALLRAASQVWENSPDINFVFMGPGSAEERNQFANLDSRAKYLGSATDQEKADAMAACTIFCMPSTSEILPTVYLEAWSLGKPVVAGTAHGLKELVEGNGAGFCAPQDPQELAAILLKLLGDPRLQVQQGKAGENLVGRKYSTKAVSSRLVEIYESAVKTRRGAR